MLNFRLMRHLWIFMAVAEEQHFGRAARRLGMSQPPLTEQIQVLEQALKVRLFERSRKGATLTPVGRAILPAVQRFAAQMAQLERAVREATAGQTGTLTIGAISSAMLEALPPLLQRLRTRHPDISVAVREIDSADAVFALRTGEIDLAFARLQGDLGKDIAMRQLTQDRLALAVPATHALAKAKRVRLRQLADEAFVMFAREVSPGYFDSIIAGCQAHGFSPRILHDVRTVASQIAFVGCGQGLALIPAGLRSLAPPGVTVRPLVEQIEIVTAAVAWKASAINPALALALDQWGLSGPTS
ncbi:MAG: LysR family transcriptional regulator [Azospirillum sp.]|nr:LysR family transcriptional regulator [Azospirillum sp.]